jgi:hypothetical protein
MVLSSLDLLIIIGSIVLALALLSLGQWIERQLGEARLRAQSRVWHEEVAPKIILSLPETPSDDAEPGYNVAADTVAYMNKMDAETQAYIAKLRYEQ